MDVERTMEFILENLADLGVKQARTDRQMRGLQTIVKTGMRMLGKMQEQGVKTRQEIAKTQQELRSLAASQKDLAASQKDLAASQKDLAASQKDLAASQKDLSASQKRTDQVLRELAEAQKRTEEKFQRWLDRGGNGRGSTR